MSFQDGGIFYMSAGIEYANEAYVWIGQTQITTKLEGEVSLIN